MKANKKILLIQTAFLGDVIMTTPLINALHISFPDDLIDIVTIPESAAIFTHDPAIHRVLTFNKKKLFRKIVSFIRLVSELRKTKYDLGFSIQSSLTSSFLMILGNIPKRVGFARQKFISIPVTHEKGMHMRDRYLSLIQPFSSEHFSRETELHLSEKEKTFAANILQKHADPYKKLIGVAPGSVWPTKRWPKAYFIELVKRLKDENYQFFFIGGGNEREICQDIIDQSDAQAHNMAGSLTILESAALIQKLDLIITNDSAPLHIANAVKTNCIAMFGPTVRRFGCYPYRDKDLLLEVDLYCRPCSKHGGKKCPEKHFRCMLEITPEIVRRAVAVLMLSES